MNHEFEIAEKLLNKDDINLYIQIGQQVHGKSAFPLHKDVYVQIAKQWLDTRRHKIAETICHNKELKAFAKRDLPTHELVVLVCAIADVISHLTTGVAPLTVAVLLARQGLHTLCGDNWEINI